ncbi:MAG: peroxide stress protein YaaA, partial [Myxococcota bacterium]
LTTLMKVSDAIATLNVSRYASFSVPFTDENSKPAALAFAGAVFRGLDAPSLTDDELAYAQDHLAILSGLYGVLRPLDRMQPYRLEMGTRLKSARGRNLYDFWGDRITAALDVLTEGHASRVVVNLASNEYAKSVVASGLSGGMVTPQFKEEKNGALSVVAVYAKRARGEMARYLIQHRIDRPEGIKDFTGMGYRYRPSGSTEGTWLFVR